MSDVSGCTRGGESPRIVLACIDSRSCTTTVSGSGFWGYDPGHPAMWPSSQGFLPIRQTLDLFLRGGPPIKLDRTVW